MTAEKIAKTQEPQIENNLSEEIIRKYKILDEKCDEVLKRIKKRRPSK